MSRKKQVKDCTSLFITGFIQVFFVSINTYFLAKEIYVGVVFASFSISMIWSYNVKRVVFGSMLHRFMYAAGAAVGATIGLYSSSTIVKMLDELTCYITK
jgi:ABC-type uncharacterized transport system permease subunit